MGGLDGFAYSALRSIGELLVKTFPSLRDDIVSADIHVYPHAYAARVALFCLVAFGLGFTLATPASLILSQLGFFTLLQGVALSTLIPFLAAGVVFAMGLAYPKIKKSSRASNFDLETPYLSVYVTVMATGGISPYTSFERLARAPITLFREVSKEARRFFVRVRALGEDPLTAIEESAKRVPHEGYKQMLLGYAATLRAGGDAVHYLQRQTEVMLRERVSQVRIAGERIAMLLEAYMAMVLLTSMTIYVMYVVSMAMAQAGMGVAGGELQFAMFSYIIMPMMSGLFIYIADIMQPKYPVYDVKPYYVYFTVGLPLTLFLFSSMALPFMVSPPLSDVLQSVFLPLASFVKVLTVALGMGAGFESGVGMIFAMSIGLIPPTIAEALSSAKFSGIQYGLTRFLRDLVEVRKTGMSPEKCIINLRNRDYGRFTPYLKEIAKQVGWGVPLGKIFDRFAIGMKNWFALISTYLLVESIEVGGGMPETLEALASFAETLEHIEREKKASLRPLMLMPYVGSLIITVIVIILVSFMGSMMRFAGAPISESQLINMFMPPVVLNSYLMGLAAGKISAERTAAGFKHALLLTISNIVAMVLGPAIVQGLMPRL
ncbi:MAG: type II secretion system F family protein [Thermofilaceae archaeon]|nr:type II secretion system F family protein [Thermofilaceae archaeon]MDW8003418.1 type II secretion system F family protein [Thermofilaceae archaeon]